MRVALEIAKWGFWLLAVVGFVAAYALYSFPVHLPFASLLSMAGASAALVALGFVVRGLQRSKFR